MKIGISLVFGTFALAATASAATVAPGSGAYTFTGAVTSATSTQCPYAAKASLAGYTVLGVNTFTTFNPVRQIIALNRGPDLLFSPGGNAPKTVIALKDVAFIGATPATGTATVTRLPSTDIVKGTYKFTLTTSTAKSLTGTLALTLNTAPTKCTTSYSLVFTKGLPAKLLNLL